MSDFYSFAVKGIDGVTDLLAPLRGSVALVVNVASRCGYTPQYAGLERLYRELKGQRFTVIGFPCNQFGAQEPGSEADIMKFCATTYNVTFPLSAKIDVKGPHQHPLYAWLTDETNGRAGEIQWNFEKFLISRAGRVVGRYPSGTKAEDNGLLQEIAGQLGTDFFS
ncbi:MAG: glutathione peroxidase [Gammaproteobacteria bacterium]|nr:glutathione peroxidase [Gammaproteobacteria bacterium]